MATVRPISTFILSATIRNASYLMSACTLEKSRIVLLPSVEVQAAFDVDAAFARACSASTSLSGGDNHLGRFGADGVGVD